MKNKIALLVLILPLFCHLTAYCDTIDSTKRTPFLTDCYCIKSHQKDGTSHHLLRLDFPVNKNSHQGQSFFLFVAAAKRVEKHWTGKVTGIIRCTYDKNLSPPLMTAMALKYSPEGKCGFVVVTSALRQESVVDVLVQEVCFDKTSFSKDISSVISELSTQNQRAEKEDAIEMDSLLCYRMKGPASKIAEMKINVLESEDSIKEKTFSGMVAMIGVWKNKGASTDVIFSLTQWSKSQGLDILTGESSLERKKKIKSIKSSQLPFKMRVLEMKE